MRAVAMSAGSHVLHRAGGAHAAAPARCALLLRAGSAACRAPSAFTSGSGRRSRSSCSSDAAGRGRIGGCSTGGAAGGRARGCARTTALRVRAADDRPPPSPSAAKPGAGLAARFNPVYAAIFGAYAALLLLRNPYVYAGLTIAAVLPQNSNVTSLNNLVLLFYESGLFMNFAEAVTCVRLVTWLSVAFMVASFALFR